MSYEEACALCEEHSNGNLVVINSQEEGQNLQEWLQSQGITDRFWTGITGVQKSPDSPPSTAELMPYQCIENCDGELECFK